MSEISLRKQHAPETPDSPQWDIAFRALTVGYGDHVVLRDIEATLPGGKISVILGGSGCGKSTLLRHIIGLSRPLSGSVHIGGLDMCALPAAQARRIRRRMGVLFQDGALLGALSLAQNVALPLTEHVRLPKAVIREAALRVLRLVGLEDFADYYPNQLSGGMRKRAGLARAIIAEPRILLCDEPTSGLDPITAARMDALLLSLHERFPDMSIVVVSHDLDSLRAIADHVLVLREGHAVFSGSLAELEARDDPYLRQFLRREADAEDLAAQDAESDPRVRAALARWLDA
ncbi:ATP-binding cassette domain-containing protein [uncultured Desulfovibrio sp.]|uniref:ATP-binding cassette domain-containing protein n=1 Tax=Candidatus Desulfovibrio intestinavium TaxID=2838534 RepID=A0A9D2HM87_9BACT|nr:ATP-binding cassette domain-containing protein [uncultured Desulfovibrio sp.]HJA78304.1 ATP-binding cassette domain-containing protein [Candidatus Desulfovibrio intestinavium]